MVKLTSAGVIVIEIFIFKLNAAGVIVIEIFIFKLNAANLLMCTVIVLFQITSFQLVLASVTYTIWKSPKEWMLTTDMRVLLLALSDFSSMVKL